MQDLWSKLLARQTNEPSAFPKRAIETIASLDKAYAELFKKTVSIVWMVYQQFVLFINDVDERIYNEANLNYTSLSHLDKLGVINFNNVTGFAFTDKSEKKLAHYFEKPILLELKNTSENTLQKGKAMLSQTGLELLKKCGSKPNIEFLEYTLDRGLSDDKRTTSCPISAKDTHIAC